MPVRCILHRSYDQIHPYMYLSSFIGLIKSDASFAGLVSEMKTWTDLQRVHDTSRHVRQPMFYFTVDFIVMAFDTQRCHSA